MRNEAMESAKANPASDPHAGDSGKLSTRVNSSSPDHAVSASLHDEIERARSAVTALRDFAREYGLHFRQRDPLVLAIHKAIDRAEAAEHALSHLRETLEKLIAKWHANAVMLAEGNKAEGFDEGAGMQFSCAKELVDTLSTLGIRHKEEKEETHARVDDSGDSGIPCHRDGQAE